MLPRPVNQREHVVFSGLKRLSMKISMSFLLVRAMLLLVLLSQPAFGAEAAKEISLIERMILDGKAFIAVPAAFSLMSDEMRKLKYPNENRPAVVYTDERGAVNVAVNLTALSVSPDQLEATHETVVTNFRNLYPSAAWYESRLFEREGQRFFVIDLMTPAIDTEVRNMMLGTSCGGRLLVVSFNVMRELAPAWIETGHKILSSLKIRCDDLTT
jgi:hypothetical protein